MKTFRWAIAGCLLVLFVACKNDTKEKSETTEEATEVAEEAEKVEEKAAAKTLEIALEARSESNATGTVYFKEKDGVVSMEAKITGLSAGSHAIHLHESSDCSSADGKSTGGHWNPTFQPHGEWGAESGYHKGDIGNFQANDSGQGVVAFSTDEWCIGCGDPNKDILGKAVVVHQGTDDFTSQPSGAAGARISCGGVIE